MYWSIDDQNSVCDHRKTEGPKLSTYIMSLIFVWLLED